MKIKVLHVVYSLDMGGMENGIVNIAKSIDKDRVEVSVLCLGHKGVLSQRLPGNIQIFELNKSPGFDIRLIVYMRRILVSYRPDVVHTHNLGPLIYVSLVKIFFHQFRIMHGEHASLTHLDLKLRKRLQRIFLYSMCNCLHTVGSGMTRQIRETGIVGNRLSTIRNGVDLKVFVPEDLTTNKDVVNSFYGTESKQNIGIVGRFGKYKGHEKLFQVFESLGKDMKNLHLYVVGSGGESEERVKLCAEQHVFANRIHMEGYQDNTVPYYQLIDLLVVASENEGLSNCILESMACGTPVLSSPSCGASDVIQHLQSGYIMPSNDTPSLKAALLYLLVHHNGDLKSLGDCAREYIEKYYSLESMVQGYYQAYMFFSMALNE